MPPTNCSYFYLCAEFGTYPPVRMLAGLRAENQAQFWGGCVSDSVSSTTVGRTVLSAITSLAQSDSLAGARFDCPFDGAVKDVESASRAARVWGVRLLAAAAAYLASLWNFSNNHRSNSLYAH